MNKQSLFIFLLSLSMLFSTNVLAQCPDTIHLPAPMKTGGKPLFDALMARVSTKAFTDKEVSIQEISNILWSAYGFNREDKRVIPTSGNHQHLSVYVFFKDSVYLYEAKENKLIKKADGDHRQKVGRQDFVYVAPVNLLYVADGTKEVGTGSHISVGCAAQDVYLVCASQGLGCVVRTGFDADALRTLLELPETDELIAAQTIGYAPVAETQSKVNRLRGARLRSW